MAYRQGSSSSSSPSRFSDGYQDLNVGMPLDFIGIPPPDIWYQPTARIRPTVGHIQQGPSYVPEPFHRGLFYGPPHTFGMNPYENPYLPPQPSTSSFVRVPSYPDVLASVRTPQGVAPPVGPYGGAYPMFNISEEQEVHSTSLNDYPMSGVCSSGYGMIAYSIPVITSTGNLSGNNRGFHHGRNSWNRLKRTYPEPEFELNRSPRQKSNRGILFIQNLRSSMDDAEVRRIFGAFGTLLDVAVHYDKRGNSLCSADVIYSDLGEAVRAKLSLSGSNSRGMIVNIMQDY